MLPHYIAGIIRPDHMMWNVLLLIHCFLCVGGSSLYYVSVTFSLVHSYATENNTIVVGLFGI